SWAIIFLKFQSFRRAARESGEVWEALETHEHSLADLRDLVEPYTEAPEAALVKAGFDTWATTSAPAASEAPLQNVVHALERASNREILRFERYLTLLATTASVSPFIGLFGTVWGIMNTFRSLGFNGSSSLAVVAPGIAEALVATAMGLAAAIPAVMGYNHYVRRVRVVAADLENFSSAFLDHLHLAGS
ncbi:MAG: MotA/TolQ/ExbB proton channel family protein, partial [Acidobacteriota bacterium]